MCLRGLRWTRAVSWGGDAVWFGVDGIRLGEGYRVVWGGGFGARGKEPGAGCGDRGLVFEFGGAGDGSHRGGLPDQQPGEAQAARL